MKLQVGLTLALAGLVGVLGASSADAAISRDSSSRPPLGYIASADPFAALPTLPHSPVLVQLRGIDERASKAAECVALCELAAGVDAHPFGVASAEPLNRSEDAWGNYRFTSELETSHNRFGFTGHYWDKEASLYYAKARYYDPFTARFTQADSFLGTIDDPPSLHRYFYANENPTMYVDSTGFAAKITKTGQGIAFGTDDTTVYANPTLDQLRNEVDSGDMSRAEAVFRQTETTLRPAADTPDWQKSSSRLWVEGGTRQLAADASYPMLQVMHGMLNNDAREIAEGGGGLVFMALLPKALDKALGTAASGLARLFPSWNKALRLPRLFGAEAPRPALAPDFESLGGEFLDDGIQKTQPFAPSARVGTATNPKQIVVDADAHPGSVKHMEDAGVIGQPRQVNRAAAPANRVEALRGKKKVPGMDLDEAPPAFLRKPGDPVSVRPLLPCDNRGCGSTMGNQARDVPEGGWVVIVPRKKS